MLPFAISQVYYGQSSTGWSHNGVLLLLVNCVKTVFSKWSSCLTRGDQHLEIRNILCCCCCCCFAWFLNLINSVEMRIIQIINVGKRGNAVCCTFLQYFSLALPNSNGSFLAHDGLIGEYGMVRTILRLDLFPSCIIYLLKFFDLAIPHRSFYAVWNSFGIGKQVV